MSFVSTDLRNYESQIQNYRRETKTTANRDFSSSYFLKLDLLQKDMLSLNYQLNVIREMKDQFAVNDKFDISNLLFLGSGTVSEGFIIDKVKEIETLQMKRDKLLAEATSDNRVVKEEVGVYLPKALLRNAMVSYADKSKLIVLVVLDNGAENVNDASFADNNVVKAEVVA